MAKQARAKQSDKESKDTKKSAVYLRISKDPDMDGLAIDRQREDCIQILRQRGWELHDEYVDQSVSAYDKTKHRKDYERMVQDFKAGKFQCLVCWDIDRLTRQPTELEWWIDAAQTKGLLLVAANGEADLTTDNGILFAGIKAQVARAEVMRKSARQKRAYKQRAKAGKTVQPGVRAMGYNYDGTINEAEAAVIDENTDAQIQSLWQVIDQDPDFPFPDYHGEEMTIQDCWIAFEKRPIQDAVRSLMRKMNIDAVELEENYEKTKFCGVNLLSPCTESNAQLVHKRYVEQFPHMFTPMEPDEQIAHFHEHCEQVETDKVVCYCKFCTDGINMGGKQGLHLIELLFPTEAA